MSLSLTTCSRVIPSNVAAFTMRLRSVTLPTVVGAKGSGASGMGLLSLPTMGETGGPPEVDMHRSSRDPQELRPRLESWLAGLLPAGAEPKIPELEATSANGMSSETVLFTAEWSEAGTAKSEQLVARIAPDPADVPV